MLFDVSQFPVRALDRNQGYKPLDFGYRGVLGSLSDTGGLVCVTKAHARWGMATLGSVPPFDEALRYNPDAVRRYRDAIVRNDGFGLRPAGAIIESRGYLLADAIPMLRIMYADGSTAECITFTPHEGPWDVLQLWRTSGQDNDPLFTGECRLACAAYTQLTEAGALQRPSAETSIRHSGQRRYLANAALPAHALLDVAMEAHVPAGEQGWVLAIALREEPDPAWPDGKSFDEAWRLLGQALRSWRSALETHAGDLIASRGISYGRRCAVPVGDDAVCVITDHMLLPLSWTRDAYWAVQPLRGEPDGQSLIRRHLIWLFTVAQRDDGYWGRAYLTNGRVKDRTYQLDQQLYPLLELAQYVDDTGDFALLSRLRPDVDAVLADLDGRRGDGWLIATDETPADDPIAMPYHFSSHILLWFAQRCLSRIGVQWGAPEAVRQQVRAAFTAHQGGQALFAYAVNDGGDAHFYHDANDLPLALAPSWGFCDARDPVWLATMHFAFSEANHGGFYAGHLGSVHTPAPWPLGDLQAAMVGGMIGDAAGEQAAWDALRAASQWDGALPEAYEPHTHRVVSRHWFLWPNAWYASVSREWVKGFVES
jgi:uncharacterized protein